jgi:hypothetical protein
MRSELFCHSLRGVLRVLPTLVLLLAVFENGAFMPVIGPVYVIGTCQCFHSLTMI